LKKQSEELSLVIRDFIRYIEGENYHVSDFIWDERYFLHISPMDNEHRVLIEKMNLFLSSLNVNNLNEKIRTFDQLTEYTLKHFADEEKYMESISYPDLINHKKIHKALVNQVLIYKENLEEGKVNKLKISNFLKDWLGQHIIGQDKKYAKFSRDHQEDV
jgi:hemerythrin